ncbi:ATP-binding protein [Azotosporobacter soli]|uniref:ATP-binding protein n=1 Tax=Azotosporobacter soli TaxID=3055040 RepID=UPI0031FE7719
MKVHLLEVAFRDYDGYRLVRHCLYEVLRKVVLDSGAMEVALNEAVNNALLHGGCEQRHTQVVVKMDVIAGRRLIVRVADGGGGFAHPGKAGNGHGVGETVRDGIMAESGRGLHIMQMLTDYMRYNQAGNEVLLMKRIDEAAVKIGG